MALFEISKAFLHTGQDLDLGNDVVVRHPKIADIIAINHGFLCDAIYWSYVSILLSDPYDNMVFLDDRGLDYETQTPFDVFCQKWDAGMDHSVICDALEFFLGKHKFSVMRLPDQRSVIYDKNNAHYAFGGQVFDYVASFISRIHCIDRTDKIQPASPSAKRILIEDMRDEQKRLLRKRPKQGEHEILGPLISAAVYGGSGAITPFNFVDLGIFQLMNAASVPQKKQRTGAILNGIYTGMLHADKIPKEDFRWD